MEGPSLHLLAQELQSFVHQTIQDITGNAKFDKEPLRNQSIKAIYAFGKRLIIQLDTHAILVHFLMYGSYRINEVREGMSPRLRIVTSQDELIFYNCAISCIPHHNLKRKLPLTRDILSPRWQKEAVLADLAKNPHESLDDVLLDQEIFPGVGNIIKNEVLFLSHLLPQRKVEELSTEERENLVLNTRKFSQKFLRLRKKFELKKNLLIYRKKECPECKGPVMRKKTGKRNRWSFFCPHCQK